jgi:8-oxo-dGTP pyrophosphatase MutT (NUDIX family)
MPISTGAVQQSGVLAVRAGMLCVVTSRSGKRWVVPKGCLEPGKSAREIALQEAWEEAGLAGLLDPDPLGSYFYEKAGDTCHVLVYRLEVVQIADSWPEQGQRERRWLSIPQAALAVEDLGLRELIRRLGTTSVG